MMMTPKCALANRPPRWAVEQFCSGKDTFTRSIANHSN